MQDYSQMTLLLKADEIDRKIKSKDDQARLQADLDSLAEWEKQWDMSFHPDKCQVLQVSNKKIKLEFSSKTNRE